MGEAGFSANSAWYNIFKPWSFQGIIVPVILGGLVSLKDAGFG